MAEVQEEWVRQCLSLKQMTLPTGLIVYFPHIRMTSSGYIQDNTKVRNLPIQNLATAEIIPIGVTYVWHHMKELNLNSLLVNTVHDSMITEEDPEETEVLDEITTKAFDEEVISYLDKVYNIKFDIPLEIDTTINDNWGYSYGTN